MDVTDYPKKIVVIGDGYVGKTSILHAMKNFTFQEEKPTVYEECDFVGNVNGKKLIVTLIDTAGQEEFYMLRKLSCKDANIFFLCFAVDDKVSFENVQSKWILDLDDYKHIPMVLVGTKLDLRTNDNDPNCVSSETALKYQKEIGAAAYIECSAKTGAGIEALKKCALRVAYRNQKQKCVVQ